MKGKRKSDSEDTSSSDGDESTTSDNDSSDTGDSSVSDAREEKKKQANGKDQKKRKLDVPSSKKSASESKKSKLGDISTTVPISANPSSGSKEAKVPILNERDGKARILQYLKEQNRPYSHIIIHDNLRGAVRKPLVAKLCDELVASEHLTSKSFGKTILYMAKQVEVSVDQATINTMDSNILKLVSECASMKETVDRFNEELKLILKEPDDDTLATVIANTTLENERLTKRIESAKLTSNKISQSEIDATQTKYNYYLNEWKKRKRYCMELIEGIFGELDKKQLNKIISDKGIETDADVKLDLEEYKKLDLVVPKSGISKKPK